MGPVMISAKHRLSWTPSSSGFFLLSEVSFHRCAETPRRRAKSTRRRAPSSSPPSSCLSEVRSPSPYTQPSSGLFALKIPNCSFFSALRAAGGAFQLSCNGARGGAAWVREACLAAWCRKFHSLCGAAGSASMVAAAVARRRQFLAAQDGVLVLCAEHDAHERPRCRDSRSMYRLSRSRGRHHFSMR